MLLILLPFAAFAFKRGLVFIVLVGLLSPSMIKNAHALQRAQPSEIAGTSQGIGAPEDSLEMANQPDSLSWWQTPFMNDNQEALNSYQRGKYKDAVNQFNDDTWKASSLYKSGDYEGALNAFKSIPGPESLYNQGNALAKLGKLEDAIKKYDQALSEAPDFADARTNKKIVEDLLKQQQQNQDQNQNENGDDGEQSDSQDNGQQQSGDQNNQEGSNEQNGQQDDNEGQQSDQSQANDEQQSGGDNSQQPDDSEMNSQNESSDSQQQNAEQEQSDQGDGAQQDSAQAQKDEQQAEQEAQAMQGQETELTDAEKEELQRMESLMRRVPDDPAFLLKRKMQLEAQKRQRQRMPSNRSDW